nr:unnamed protein product [Digitaria exilis]
MAWQLEQAGLRRGRERGEGRGRRFGLWLWKVDDDSLRATGAPPTAGPPLLAALLK